MFKLNDVFIIIPVYKAYDHFKECLYALSRFYLNINIIIIDDGNEVGLISKIVKSTYKEEGNQNITILRNNYNLGFVKSCNLASAHVTNSNHTGVMLLLNSDAIVTKGSIEKMLHVMHHAENASVVCPRTNNGSILSYAKFYNGSKYLSYSIWFLSRFFIKSHHRIPTGVGFCMMIRSTVIQKFKLFDEIYGLGYNEENDFCMRILDFGHFCYAANKSYVFHIGKSSFDHKDSNDLESHNRKILDSRYPNYTNLVSEYVNDRKFWISKKILCLLGGHRK
jgi:GT2 family glycosyltransferase